MNKRQNTVTTITAEWMFETMLLLKAETKITHFFHQWHQRQEFPESRCLSLGNATDAWDEHTHQPTYSYNSLAVTRQTVQNVLWLWLNSYSNQIKQIQSNYQTLSCWLWWYFITCRSRAKINPRTYCATQSGNETPSRVTTYWGNWHTTRLTHFIKPHCKYN